MQGVVRWHHLAPSMSFFPATLSGVQHLAPPKSVPCTQSEKRRGDVARREGGMVARREGGMVARREGGMVARREGGMVARREGGNGVFGG